MGRAPCCEKIGMKKGAWTREEDETLVDYIRLHGHSNWRALPKLAGLLRCGKSCRLRWMNYLRPDIKRGNFTPQEEDTIVELHSILGSRWSTIAAKLPGRTDNEIKNVWHARLKKMVSVSNQNSSCSPPQVSKKRGTAGHKCEESGLIVINKNQDNEPSTKSESMVEEVSSPRRCSSDNMSSSLTTTTTATLKEGEFCEEMDESFWSEVLSTPNYSTMEVAHSFSAEFDLESGLYRFDSPVSRLDCKPDIDDVTEMAHSTVDCSSNSSMNFWYNLLTGDKELSEQQLPPV